MTTGTLRTQGSELFFVEYLSASDPVVQKLSCPTGISGLGGPADQLDDTCLDSTERTFKRGLGNPGPVTVPFNFIPSALSHQLLFSLQEAGTVLKWLIAFSDGTAIPIVADSDGYPAAPLSPLRTSIAFDGYISDVNIDISTNEIVRGTLIVQRSGPLIPNWNGPVAT